MACDLSVNNSSALHGTNLMLLCGKLDERVTSLTQIIIYWAKHFRLVGGPGKFKTYAIFLMVVYFLQVRNPPVLPSVETMFEKTEFLKNLENWSYDITEYLSHFEKSHNSQTVQELLREFFVFYGNYDFSHIVCPISSSTIDRKLFPTKIDCNNSFELNTICIQDPLNLSWNVTTEVSWKHCKTFSKALISVWEKYQDRSRWIPQTQEWGVSFLLDNKLTHGSLTHVKEFTVDLPLASAMDDLFKRAAHNVAHILNYCLDFECYPLDLNTDFGHLGFPRNVKNQLLKADACLPETNLGDHSRPQLVAQYVSAAKDTWLGRNTYISLTDSSNNVLDDEHRISKKLRLERECIEKEAFYFLCECYSVCVEGKQSLQVKFKLLNSDRFIPKLVIFLKEYIPELFEEAMCKEK